MDAQTPTVISRGNWSGEYLILEVSTLPKREKSESVDKIVQCVRKSCAPLIAANMFLYSVIVCSCEMLRSAGRQNIQDFKCLSGGGSKNVTGSPAPTVVFVSGLVTENNCKMSLDVTRLLVAVCPPPPRLSQFELQQGR